MTIPNAPTPRNCTTWYPFSFKYWMADFIWVSDRLPLIFLENYNNCSSGDKKLGVYADVEPPDPILTLG